jgi:hypothetical protein
MHPYIWNQILSFSFLVAQDSITSAYFPKDSVDSLPPMTFSISSAYVSYFSIIIYLEVNVGNKMA